MAKFHINSKGEPGACRATSGSCPFGGEENHYGSEADAYAAIADQNTSVKTLKKPKYFDKDGKTVGKEEMLAAVELAKAENRLDDYYTLRKGYEAAENGTVEVTQEFINNAYNRPVTLYTENEDKTDAEREAGYAAVMSSDEPSYHKEGHALYELLSDTKTPDSLKADFYANASDAHKEALAQFLANKSSYGRNEIALLPQEATRFYMETDNQEVMSQGMYAPGLTIEQKYALAKKYPNGYLELANAAKLRPINTNNELGKEIYEASLSRIADPNLSTESRGAYYTMLSKDLTKPAEIASTFSAFKIQDDTAQFYQLHEGVISNEHTDDATRLAALNESFAFNPTISSSIIQSLPKKYYNVMWPSATAGDNSKLVPEQKAAYEAARAKLDATIAHWSASDDYNAPRYVADHKETRQALDILLQENPRAAWKAAESEEARTLKVFKKANKSNAPELEEARAAAIAAQNTVKLYNKVAPVASLHRALIKRLTPVAPETANN